jgi:hypothetical protein
MGEKWPPRGAPRGRNQLTNVGAMTEGVTAWFEYNHEQMQRVVPFRLREVDVELTPTPEPPAE